MSARWLVLLLAVALFGSAAPLTAAAERPQDRMALSGLATFPQGWEARGNELRPTELYEVVAEPAGPFLRSIDRPDGVRIFKKIAWDSATYPIIEWKWRVKKWPANEAAQVVVYVSLDTDIFGIPTILKYTWSRSKPAGVAEAGGFFRPVETIIRSGPADDPSGWIVERINVRAEFERYVERAPKGAAYGVGLLADPGVIVEVGEIAAVVRPAP